MHKPFKGSFTLKQFAAFTLTANWALDQHEKLITTQHFHNLVKKNMKFSGDEAVFKKEQEKENAEQSIINSIRNYFSHYLHDELRALTRAETDDLNNLVRRLLVEANNRNIDANDKDKIQNIIKDFLDNPNNLFNFEAKPILDHTHPEIAIMLALFLSKGQMAFLCGKIFFGKNTTIKQQCGSSEDIPKTHLQKKLLNLLAQPDNIIMRKQADGEADPWLGKKHEQGFAIWQLLVNSRKKTVDGEQPDYLKNSNYMIRQLVRFIELHKVLPGYEFARIETVETLSDDVKKLEQNAIFSSNPDLPLAIRHNTIQSVNQQGIKATFGMRTLIYIVVIFLEQNRVGELVNFVTTWLKDNAHYPKPERQVNEQSLSDRIAKRLHYLLTVTDTKSNLQTQIRFICQRINHVWFCKYDRYLRLHEYKELEKKVRYYRKAELCGWLEDHGLLDIQNIQLGRGGIKKLKQAIKADTIQQLHKDLLADYHNWLQEQKDKLPKLNSDAQQSLAKAINVRNNRQSNTKPNLPIGLPEKALRQEFFSIEGKDYAKSLTMILRKVHAPFTFEVPQESKSKTLKKCMQMLNYQQLLLAMAWHAVKDLIPYKKSKTMNESNKVLLDLSKIPISIYCGNIKISIKFEKSWRNMANLDKGYIEKLMRQYCPGESIIPMFRADENKVGKSVETTIQTFRAERHLFIQSLMQWEKEYCDANPAIAKSNDKTYVDFKSLAQNAKLADGTTRMRHDAFHNRVPDTRYANCPEQRIKKIYDQIYEREGTKRKSQRQKGVKRNLASQKKP